MAEVGDTKGATAPQPSRLRAVIESKGFQHSITALILITSFAVLNLFIAIIVNAMQSQHDAESKEALAAFSEQSHGDAQRLEDDLRGLREELRQLRRLLEDQRSSSRSSKVASDSAQGR